MRRTVIMLGLSIALLLAVAGCARRSLDPAFGQPSGQGVRLAQAAESQAGKTIRYDARYVRLRYPGGDVPMDRGVCSDVVVRAFRALGIDLQAEVHRDMQSAWGSYPQLWGLSGPDPNIDHRRVPNLQVFFRRKGKALRVTGRGSDYLPGDVVAWSDGGSPHIGIVSTRLAPSGTRYLVVHNHGRGVRVEDKLFAFKIVGHYRYF
jgi:uncharacterized protein YijF (DUF1287 family)